MKDIQSKDKCEGDGSMELSVICPLNHQEWNNIVDNFRFIHPTRPVNSINDYGKFYEDCLELFQKIYIAPDIVIVLGDRFETMAAATAALLLNIPIAHIAGGECTLGAFDNEIRNSITQMASYHFTATKEYAQKIAIMLNLTDYTDCINNVYYQWCSEEYIGNYTKYSDFKEANIYNVGSPGLDWLHRAKLLSKQELQQCVGINLNQPFIIACLHPETKELPETERHADEFMKALEQCSEQILLIGSNIDPGNGIIHERIWRKHCGGKEIFRVSNLDHLTYLSLLQYTEMMVGNSSSGIIESASFDLPSVCVGNRQAGRIRGGNVFDCPCETEAILTAIDRAREWNATVGKCENPYGDGKSSERIVKILEAI
jgi:UDP-N-acetylglucosamine 2-epimerase